MAERKAFLLRMDPQLWTELEAWAQDELRSVNGQIEFLLREAIQRRRGQARRAAADGSVPPAAGQGSGGGNGSAAS